MPGVVRDGQVVDHGYVLDGGRPRVVNRLGKSAAPAPVVVDIRRDDHDSNLEIEEVRGVHGRVERKKHGHGGRQLLGSGGRRIRRRGRGRRSRNLGGWRIHGGRVRRVGPAER